MRMACTNCDHVYEWYNTRCSECGHSTKLVDDVYVNVYIEQLAYGGPEEGGWWYDCGTPIESIKVLAGDSVENEITRLKKKYPNEDMEPKSNVNSTGEYVIRIEDHFAEFYPDERPRYE